MATTCSAWCCWTDRSCSERAQKPPDANRGAKHRWPWLRPGADEWTATFDVAAIGWHEYAVAGWIDRFKTWVRDLQVKAATGQEVAVELLEGSLLVREAAERAAAIEPQGGASASALLLSDRIN